ncbi:MAG: hypothetical protein ACK5NT_13745 [Pyrinomonadaceae bacterium]
MRNLLTVICLATFVFLSGCARMRATLTGLDDPSIVTIEDADFDRAAKLYNGNDVEIFDSDLFGISNDDDKNIRETQKETYMSQAGTDGSTLTTMKDGSGNNVTTREFNNSPLLKRVVVRTDVNGNSTVFVYAQNGSVERLSSSNAAEVLTAQGSDVARIAKIYETRDDLQKDKAEQVERRQQLIDDFRRESAPAPAADSIMLPAPEPKQPKPVPTSEDQTPPE